MTDNLSHNTTSSPSVANEQGTARKTVCVGRVRWSWLPSLLFGDSMVASVVVLMMIMLRRFGLDHATATLYVALVCLPFIVRPLIEMVVSHFRGTTKVWILSSEFLASLSLWAIAFTLPTSYWLQGTLCFMPFVTMSGVFHSVAVNRFYVESPSQVSPWYLLISRMFRCVSLLFGIGAVAMLAGNMEVMTRNVRYSWSVAFYVMAAVAFFLWLWHSLFLPGGVTPFVGEKDMFGLRPCEYNAVTNAIADGWRNRMRAYFFLLFVLPEAFLAPVSLLFMIDAPHNGGLGLAPQEFALAQGTIGIIGIFVGCVLGIKATRLFGLRKTLVPLALLMSVHSLSFLYLSSCAPLSLAIVCASIATGSIALGVGIAAYKTALDSYALLSSGYVMRRACALALTSVTSVAVGIVSGILLSDIGYRQMFILSTALCAVAAIAATIFSLLKRDNSQL